MRSSLVLSLVGPDRPGLVESVAALVAEHGGNWLESRMARLGGQFAGIARVELPQEREAGLRQALEELAVRQLSVGVAVDDTAPRAASGGPAAARPGLSAVLELVGQDRPGIVHQVTRILASHGVNVEDFSSDCHEAPMAGGTLFQARAEVTIPASTSAARVRAELEKIAADLMVDINLRPVA